MEKTPKNLADQKFILTMFVLACCTLLTALGRIESKDYQAIVLTILGVYASAKAISNRMKR